MGSEVMPDISALMSVYNGERWLSDAVDSVLRQSEGDFELIVVDDGSTDNTGAILESYKDKRLLVLKQRNMGLAKSLNKALGVAKGQFVARIDADDVCNSDRFKYQKLFLLENLNIAMVGSNAILIDENSNEIGRAEYPTCNGSLLQRLRKFQPVFPHSSLFFRKEVVAREGGYNLFFTRSQDSDLYLRLCDEYSFACIKRFLVKLRVNNQSLTYVDVDLQLKMGVAALICYYRRREGLRDYSKGDESEWRFFLEKVQEWLIKKRLTKRHLAKSKFRHCRTLLKRKKFCEAFRVLMECFENDALFLLYKGIGIKVPDELDGFLKQDFLGR